MADSEAPCRCPHGTAVRGERRMGGPDLACDPSDICVGASAALLRTAAQRRQGPGSSDGRFVTLRVSIGWPSESGRYAADSPRQSRSYAALRNACRCDDVAATRSGVSRTAWASRVWPVAIRWLGSDLRSGQRREYRPNVLALALRRVVASGRLVRPRTPRYWVRLGANVVLTGASGI